MIALTLLCAPLLQQVDFDPTYDPFQTTAGRLQQGSGGQGTAATSGCDHFNRANNFDRVHSCNPVHNSTEGAGPGPHGQSRGSGFSELLQPWY